jgi:outer membrane beta-barrel protein
MLKFSFLLLGLSMLLTGKVQAGEKSLYDFLWLDPDKKVYVLQNKLYKKEHSFYFDVGYLSNFTSKFQDTSGFQIKAGYYIHEEWGLEIFYNNYSNTNNDEYRNLRSVSNVEPFIRKLNSSLGAVVIWSPFYGKINTFNQIFYFDWSFGAGATALKAQSNLKTAGSLTQNNYASENYAGGVLKTNVKLHLRENIHIGLEYMNTYYNAPSPRSPGTNKLRTNTDIILSVGFSY